MKKRILQIIILALIFVLCGCADPHGYALSSDSISPTDVTDTARLTEEPLLTESAETVGHPEDVEHQDHVEHLDDTVHPDDPQSETSVPTEPLTEPVQTDNTTPFAYPVQYIRTDYFGRDRRPFPYAVAIGSAEELGAYYDKNQAYFHMERRETVYSDTTIGFPDACDRYDAAFFRDHKLLFLVLEEGSGSVRHEILDLRPSDDQTAWTVTVRCMTPELVTDDMAAWHLMLELPADMPVSADNISIVLVE